MDVACPACLTATWLPLHTVDGHTYVRCPTCAIARLDPLPSPADASTVYDLGYFEGGGSGGYLDYDGEAGARRANARATLRRLRARSGVPGRLLEVGSASGWLLLEAAHQGWAVTGVEVNDEMRGRAAARLAPTAVLHRSLGEVEGASTYDAAVLVQVLEHVPDAGGALDDLALLVRPGGTILIETWNRCSLVARLSGARWQQVTPPSVVWLFSERGIVEALRARGFAHVTVERTSKRVGLGSVVSLLAEKAPIGRRWLQTLATSDPIRTRTIPYRFGDLITVTATRG